MTHASLFSGIGGFDLAAKWAGWTNAFNCEIDPFCQQVLKYHFPHATQYSDIKSTDFTLWRGRISVLTGGFPCQPFSLAGKRKGTEDERHLWPEMLRAIREIQPRWVVGENVLGIVNWSRGLVFEQVCADLEAAGYEVQPYLLPACGVGAPHQRYRVWFVAKNTECVRCNSREPKEEPRAGGFGKSGTGDHVRVCGAEGIDPNSSDAGVKAMQGWQDGILSLGAVTNGTDERRRPRSCEADKRQECPQNGRGIQSAVDGPCGGGAIADPGSLKRPTRMHQGFKADNSKARTTLHDRASRLSNNEPIADTDNKRLKQQSRNYLTNKPRQSGRCNAPCGFDDFPTQSPVCSRNDGFSARLDGITFPKWRMQSIKAYGNAIVPQVVYQIFEAINEFEKQSKL